jgi:hypothetical protein
MKHHFDEVLAEDTYLVSFPRSGNTWLRCLLTAVVHDGELTPDLLAQTVPDVHHSDPAVRPRAGPIWVKSHFPAPPRPFAGRVLYLVRHGLDAMMSYHHYLQLRGRVGPNVAFDEFVESSDVWPCPWPDHVQGWLDALDAVPPNRREVVRYEDLLARPHEQLSEICRFLGLVPDPAAIDVAVSVSRPERLAGLEAATGSGSLNHVGRKPAVQQGHGPGTERFLADCAPILVRAGYRSE